MSSSPRSCPTRRPSKVLSDLSKLLELDPERARAILKRLMPPVVLTPTRGGWKLSGGLDWEALLDDQGAQREVGGTGIEPATRAV